MSAFQDYFPPNDANARLSGAATMDLVEDGIPVSTGDAKPRLPAHPARETIRKVVAAEWQIRPAPPTRGHMDSLGSLLHRGRLHDADKAHDRELIGRQSARLGHSS